MIVTKNKENFLFSVYDHYGVKLLTRLRLHFSSQKEHKFRIGFGDTVSPMYGYNAEIEDTKHDLWRCHFYSIQRFERFNNINKVDPFFTQFDTKEQANIMLYCYPPSKPNALNQDIIKFVINFLKISGRFDKPCVMYCYFFFLPICLFYVFLFCFCFFFFFVRK